jgi:hypothetical protein
MYSSFAILLFFLALRWETGTDWFSYHDYFIDLDDIHGFETGFVLENQIIRAVTGSFTIFLLINSFIALTPIFYIVFRELKELAPLGILIFYSYYYLINYFGSNRRIIAIALIFASAYLILDGYKKWAILLILIAACFHSSAYTCFLFFPFATSGPMKKTYFRIVVAGIALALAVFIFYDKIISNPFLSRPILHFLYYTDAETGAPPPGYNKLFVSLLSIAKRSLILIFILYSMMRFKVKDLRMVFYLRCYALSFILYVVSSLTIDMFATFTIYFSIFEIVLVPQLIFLYKNWARVLLLLLFAFYLIFQTYSATFGNPYAELYIPYHWIGGRFN